MLKYKKKGYQIGFSDHTLTMNASLIAVSLGARVIEKHVTVNKKLKGPDHKFSLNMKEFNELVTNIREVEKIIKFKKREKFKYKRKVIIKDLTLKILYTMKSRLANVTDTKFEAHDLSWHDAEMLDYWTTGIKFFSSKERKGSPVYTGLLGRDIKNLLRYNNALLSVMGQKTTLTLWSRLQEMSKENPNWFNQNHVLYDWIGLLSPKCYFEKT